VVDRAGVCGASPPEKAGTMIVWSKGLGKQTLPIELDKAEVRIENECVSVGGIIEPVWWQYTIKLNERDLLHFLRILSSAKTSSFLAAERGVFWWFMKRLVRFIPQVLLGMVKKRGGQHL